MTSASSSARRAAILAEHTGQTQTEPQCQEAGEARDVAALGVRSHPEARAAALSTSGAVPALPHPLERGQSPQPMAKHPTFEPLLSTVLLAPKLL